MKIFISHSSKDEFYGQKLVDLLRGVGVHEEEIIFTSNSVYGIPTGENIFNWLKSQITQNPFVIYLLSKDYYNSIACLNEMGAAWIIENKHAAIFIPDFDLESLEFQSAALDPRELGFFINEEERILLLLQALTTDFKISRSIPLINQEVKKFLIEIEKYNKRRSERIDKVALGNLEPITDTTVHVDLFTSLITLIATLKLNEEELIFLNYIIETGRTKLKTGWQMENEISNIIEWEKLNEIDNQLSNNYSSVLNRFEMRGFAEVSATTESGKPKELKIKDEISRYLLDLPENIKTIISESVYKSHCLFLEKRDLSQSLFSEEKDVWEYIYKFADILIKNFPKNESGVIHSNNLNRIDKLFQSLKDCEEDFENHLWWNNGSSNIEFNLTQKGEGVWRFNNREFNIAEIWIHYDSSSFNDFIIVHFRKGEPFIINGQEQYYNIIVDDKFEITYSEFENKLAEINDVIINLSEHKVEFTERSKEAGFLIISTRFHCAIRGANDETIREFIEKMKSTNGVVSLEEFQDFQFKIRVHKHVKVDADL